MAANSRRSKPSLRQPPLIDGSQQIVAAFADSSRSVVTSPCNGIPCSARDQH